MNQPDLPMSGKDVSSFLAMFYDKTGIFFGDSKHYFVGRRLMDRMEATQSSALGEYLSLLRYRDPQERELQNLINALTVNETYFNRESYQFNCLTNALLPELTRNRRASDGLQIWSMPCSTGEEPYSIALHLLENWAAVDEWHIRIHATDIDTRVLQQARAGIYDARSVQHVPQAVLKRYFRQAPDMRWKIADELRASVDFSHANLSDEEDLRRFRDIDVIFCRNLLIYFDDSSRERAIAAMLTCLRPGGFLCLGHSESMDRITHGFATRKLADGIVYQRPLTEAKR